MGLFRVQLAKIKRDANISINIQPRKLVCPECDILTASDGDTPALEIWGGWSTFSLSLLPGPLWSGVEVPV